MSETDISREAVEKLARDMEGMTLFMSYDDALAMQNKGAAMLRALRDALDKAQWTQTSSHVLVPRKEIERVAEWFDAYADRDIVKGWGDQAERNAERRDFVRHWLAPLRVEEAARDE
jgi:hypothetical protein